MDVDFGLKEGSRWSPNRDPKHSDFVDKLAEGLAKHGLVFARSYSTQEVLNPKAVCIGVRKRDIERNGDGGLRQLLDESIKPGDVVVADWHNGFNWRGRSFPFDHMVTVYRDRGARVDIVDSNQLIAKQEISREMGVDLNDYYVSERGRRAIVPVVEQMARDVLAGGSSARFWWLVNIDHIVHNRLENYIAAYLERNLPSSVVVVPQSVDGDLEEYERLVAKAADAAPHISWDERGGPEVLNPEDVLKDPRTTEPVNIYFGLGKSIWSRTAPQTSSQYTEKLVDAARKTGFLISRINSSRDAFDPDVVCVAVDETFTHDYQDSNLCRTNKSRLLGLLGDVVRKQDVILYNEGGTFGGGAGHGLDDCPTRVFNTLENFVGAESRLVGTPRYMIGLQALRRGDIPIGRKMDLLNGTRDMTENFYRGYWEKTGGKPASSGRPRVYWVVWNGHVLNGWESPVIKTLEERGVNYALLTPNSVDYLGIDRTSYDRLVRRMAVLPPCGGFTFGEGYFRR